MSRQTSWSLTKHLQLATLFSPRNVCDFCVPSWRQGTVIFVSHDTAAVQNLCNRAIWIDHGSVRFMGSAKAAAARYLEALYESQQGVSALANEAPSPADRHGPGEPRDMRLDFLNHTQFRNDIEIFRFESEAPGFGKGQGRITSVALTDRDGTPCSWVVGAEEVALEIECTAKTAIHAPIIGFYIKDRLGQYLFGDNTYLTYQHAPPSVGAGGKIRGRFEFRMPVLPVGDYSVTVALADGTQQDHVQHHWIHDALVFKSQASSVSQGLIGIPMKKIEIVPVL